MNNVSLIGRLTKDPDSRQAADNKTVARLTVACDRRSKDAGADFISCVAFDKIADFISKYFRKGMKIAITGSIRTGNYTKDNGDKVYTTDVVVNNAEFVEKKADAPETIGQPTENPTDEFISIPDNIDEEIPFQ